MLDKVTAREELNLPAIVTPEIFGARVGLMPDGKALSLNHVVFEPESNRIRNGQSIEEAWSLVTTVNVKGTGLLCLFDCQLLAVYAE